VRYLTLLSLLAATSLSACSVATPKPKSYASMYAITDVTVIINVEIGSAGTVKIGSTTKDE
jgi:hypothetical protein